MPTRPPNTQKKSETKPAPNTGREGTVYLSSSGSPYQAPALDARKLKQYSKNFYGAGITRKLLALFFGDKLEIQVLDPKGEKVEDLQKEVENMTTAREVALFSKMKIGWIDRFWEGMGFFNPVWEEQGPAWSLKELRRLPPESFATQAQVAEITSGGEGVVFGTILKGVVAMPDGQIRYYQTGTSGRQTELKQVYTVKDSTAPDVAGEPEILPVAPVITMLDFAWSSQMQKTNRLGAPILLLRITNATADDIKYGEKLIKNWGKDTGFILRKNMEIVDFNPYDNETALETINKLTEMVLDYWVPTSMLAKNGQLIGGNSNSDLNLLYSYIAGVHREIESQWEPLLQIYLDANGYEGYRVKLHIPDPEINDLALKIEQAKLGIDSGLLTENEIRTRLGAEEMTPEELAKLPARIKEQRAEEAARRQEEALKLQTQTQAGAGQPPGGPGGQLRGQPGGKQTEPQANPSTQGKGGAQKVPQAQTPQALKHSRQYWPDEARAVDPDPVLTKIMDEEEAGLDLALEALARAVMAKL